jgi:hypothetical protein
MMMPPRKPTSLPTPTWSKAPADPPDGQPKNQADADRDAHRFARLPFHSMNGFILEVGEFFHATPDGPDRSPRGVNAIIDGVSGQRCEQLRLV